MWRIQHWIFRPRDDLQHLDPLLALATNHGCHVRVKCFVHLYTISDQTPGCVMMLVKVSVKLASGLQ
jgi:hypothetical protein